MTPPPPSPANPNTIGSTGGTATSQDGQAFLVVPAGALAASTEFAIAVAMNAPAGNVGAAYQYGPAGTVFSSPVTIRIAYDPAGLPQGTVEPDLVLAEVVGAQWQILEGSAADPDEDEVSGEASGLGVWGIIAVELEGLTAVAADAQVTLSWDSVPNADSYNVYWADHSDITAADDKVLGAMSPHVVGGLVNGTTYYFRVSAETAIGEGSLSAAEVSATPEAPVVLPAAPQNLSACAANQTAMLTWDGVDGASSYNVYWNDSGGVTTADNVILDVAATMLVHDGRTNGQTYHYIVTAENAFGEGDASAETSVSLTTLAPPQNLMPVARSEQMMLSWGAVDCASGYNIHWNTTGGVTAGDALIEIPSPATVAFNHMGLTNDTTYYYAIASVNALGAGALSSPEVSATPVAAPLPVSISAGSSGSPGNCVVMTDGTVKCWGRNPGIEDPDGVAETPVTVAGIGNATAVSVGPGHSCAIDAGLVKCWGANAAGQLGNGTNNSSAVPVTVLNVAGATAVEAGNTFSCAAVDDSVWCWGANSAGELGDVDPASGPGIASSNTPVLVAGLPSSSVVELSAATAISRVCTLFENLETWCWGNLPFVLGQNAASCWFNFCRPLLAPIPASGTPETLAAGRNHVCMLVSGGQVDCAGFADAQVLSPLDPPTTFSSITAGDDFNCGLSGSNVVCWGENTMGQLGGGDNTTHPYTTPIQAVGISAATDVDAGQDHSCAIDAGLVKCWGRFQPIPQEVVGF